MMEVKDVAVVLVAVAVLAALAGANYADYQSSVEGKEYFESLKIYYPEEAETYDYYIELMEQETGSYIIKTVLFTALAVVVSGGFIVWAQEASKKRSGSRVKRPKAVT